jgi:hypothetical protein
LPDWAIAKNGANTMAIRKRSFFIAKSL